MFKVLFLIENVPFSLDTRVQRESQTLMDVGATITVICPRGKEESIYSEVDGVHVYRYWKPSIGEGFISHVAEYIASLIAHTVLTVFVFFRHGFDVIHAANPPDIFWLIAAPYKLLGKRYIFDQHDLVPEMFEVRFKERLPFLYKFVLFCERCNHRLSDHVISTNESHKRIAAVGRGGKAPEQVTVVRNGPRLSRDFPTVEPDSQTQQLGDVVVGYIGIMNPQDCLEVLLDAADIVRHRHGRTDIGFVLIGSGDSYAGLMKKRDDMGLTQGVRMTGTIPWSDVLAVLSATDICVQPDPPSPYNLPNTLNKLMEYMAMGKATIAFDLPETRVSGADTVIYVPGSSADNLATAIIDLADDPAQRKQLGQAARRRIEDTLAWEHQQSNLLEVYAQVLPGQIPADAIQQARSSHL